MRKQSYGISTVPAICSISIVRLHLFADIFGVHFFFQVVSAASTQACVSDPGLPAGEEAAEVFGVHCLLNEEVYLPAHAEHRPLLNTLQLLLQSEQHTLCHFIKALTVTAETHQHINQNITML